MNFWATLYFRINWLRYEFVSVVLLFTYLSLRDKTVVDLVLAVVPSDGVLRSNKRLLTHYSVAGPNFLGSSLF